MDVDETNDIVVGLLALEKQGHRTRAAIDLMLRLSSEDSKKDARIAELEAFVMVEGECHASHKQLTKMTEDRNAWRDTAAATASDVKRFKEYNEELQSLDGLQQARIEVLEKFVKYITLDLSLPKSVRAMAKRRLSLDSVSEGQRPSETHGEYLERIGAEN